MVDRLLDQLIYSRTFLQRRNHYSSMRVVVVSLYLWTGDLLKPVETDAGQV